MSSLEFRRGGRKVSRNQFFDGIKNDAIDAAKSKIEERLRSIRDPETGEPLRFTRKPGKDNLGWNLEGSPKAIELAKKVLGGQG